MVAAPAPKHPDTQTPGKRILSAGSAKSANEPMEIRLFKTVARNQGRKVRLLTEDRTGLGRSDPDVIDGVAKNVRIAQVRDVNETMPLGRKYEIIALTLRGRSVPEIASLLNISESTVRAHLKKGARQVRKAIGGHASDAQAVLSSNPA
ncbi:MAG: sigma-70 family RNA polymerase sigma factor [Candidatus Latescibacteria bacterium]|nr:sigma-70 family RNA polymerase sigma factor [Candidatus Latescibacterota bacterium]